MNKYNELSESSRFVIDATMRKDLIEVSKLHFKAHVEKHRINVENLLEKAESINLIVSLKLK